MMKKNLFKQNGFTLIEFLVAFAISAIILTAVVTFSNSSLSINRGVNNQTNAVNQLKNAYNYISRDSQMAGAVYTTGTGFPITLTWITYPSQLTQVIYSIDGSGNLQRAEYDNQTALPVTIVAKNVNTDSAQTNTTWDTVNDKLTINLAILIGSKNVARQFVLTPRVIQSSAQNTNAIQASATPVTSGFGAVVTLTANFTPSDVTSGTITFVDDDGTQIGVVPVINGTATYPASALSIRTHTIKAVFSGNAKYISSTSPNFTAIVGKGTTTVNLSSSGTPSNLNAAVTFTASVTPSAATGTVTFKDSGTAMAGSSTVSISSGTATFTISSLSVGSHTITAVYNGDSTYNTSTSANFNQTVSKLNTTATLGSSQNPSIVNKPVTFTATVAPGAATGTVNFVDTTTSTTIGNAINVSSGTATCTYTFTTTGTHSITATYSGDTNYVGSSSSALTQTVNVNASIALSGVVSNQAQATFTATVAPAGATGTVQFKVNGTASGGPVTLSGGTATSGLISATSTTGYQTITAVYSGNGTYDTCTSVNYYLGVINTSAAVADSFMNNSTSNNLNYGGSTTMVVKAGSSTSANHIIMRYDFTALTNLSGKQVDIASLWLYQTAASNTLAITPYKVSKSWVVGTGTGTGSTSGVTWVSRDKSQNSSYNWSTPGGDTTGSAGTATTSGGASTWSNWTLTADVASFVATPANNFGWLFVGPTSTSNSATYASISYATPTSQPQMLVIYH
jgi:prepilin-type N-terminal cleavage/methylation domain-containing protein